MFMPCIVWDTCLLRNYIKFMNKRVFKKLDKIYKIFLLREVIINFIDFGIEQCCLYCSLSMEVANFSIRPLSIQILDHPLHLFLLYAHSIYLYVYGSRFFDSPSGDPGAKASVISIKYDLLRFMEFAADVRTGLSVEVARFSTILHSPEGAENVADAAAATLRG